MSTIKDRNGRDLVDAEEVKNRWKEYTEELHKNDLNEPDYYDGVVSHPKPDILESKVKWALGSTQLLKLVNVTEFQDRIPTTQNPKG